jgi:protein O-mannosyl-transferase
MVWSRVDRHRIAGMLLLLTAVSVAVFWNGLRGQFVYDDVPIIAENPLIQSLPRCLRVFSTSYWNRGLRGPQAAENSLYRPLTLFTYALNYRFAGQRPMAYKVTNLALHATVVGLLFFLTLRLGLAPGAAFFSALFFAVLPAHVEAVTNIVGRAEVLSALFLLAAWLAMFQSTRPARIAAGLAFFILAMLSKETGLLLLPALVLSELARGDTFRTTLRERWPVWTIVAIILLLFLEWRFVLLGRALSAGAVGYFAGRPKIVVALTMAKFFAVHYVGPLLTGRGIPADFTRPTFADATPGDTLAGLLWLVTLAAVGISFYGALRRRTAALGLALFFLFLLPFSHLIWPLEVIGAERFLYLPSVGFCLFLGSVGGTLWQRSKGMGIALAGVGLLWAAFWGWRAAKRNLVWLTPQGFWDTAVRESPQSPSTWQGRGFVAIRDGDLAKAKTCIDRALAINPQYLHAQINRAEIDGAEGRYAAAERGFLAVLRRRPSEEDALFGLARVAEAQANWRKAAWYYHAVVNLDPYHSAARRNLGIMLFKIGNPVEGRRQLETYLGMAPAGENTSDVRNFVATLPESRR